MFIVIYSTKGGYYAHSAHNCRKTAEEWAKCLQHDGDKDCAICEINDDVARSISDMIGGEK